MTHFIKPKTANCRKCKSFNKPCGCRTLTEARVRGFASIFVISIAIFAISYETLIFFNIIPFRPDLIWNYTQLALLLAGVISLPAFYMANGED